MLEDDGQVYLQIEEIEGLPMDEELLRTVSCRIICDAGMYSIDCQAISSTGGVVFDNRRLLVVRSANKNLDDTVKIQVLSGGEGNIARFLAMIEVRYTDLAASSGLLLTRSFSCEGRACDIHLVPFVEYGAYRESGHD